MSSPLARTAPDTVAGVLAQFDAILEWARRQGSRLGYFAALYRGVTIGAQGRLAAGGFDNPHAGERLVTLFAGRYFDALAGHLGATPVPAPWRLAFAAVERWPPTVSQHLLLGINAHINLDLGVATARTLAETALPRSDFDRVNGLLLDMIDEVERKLAGVWPLLRLLDRLAGRLDEALVGASLLHMRAEAWDFAQALRSPGADEAALIAAKDRRVAEIGRHIAAPALPLRAALLAVRLGELRSVTGIIDLLEAEVARTPVVAVATTSRPAPRD